MEAEEILSNIRANPTLLEHAKRGEDGAIARALSRPASGEPITMEGLLSSLSPESAAKLAVNPNLPAVLDALRSGNVPAFSLWVGLFAKAGVITEKEVTSISTALASQVPADVVPLDAVNKVLRPFRRDGKAGEKNWIEGGQ
jgi:hypothetical protein